MLRCVIYYFNFSIRGYLSLVLLSLKGPACHFHFCGSRGTSPFSPRRTSHSASPQADPSSNVGSSYRRGSAG
jgi:hypothetical protein